MHLHVQQLNVKKDINIVWYIEIGYLLHKHDTVNLDISCSNPGLDKNTIKFC